MKKPSEKFWLWAGLALGAVVLLILIGRSVKKEESVKDIPLPSTQPPATAATANTDSTAGQTDPTTQTDTQVQDQPTQPQSPGTETEPSLLAEPDELAQAGLELVSTGSYTGIYMEDGSDEVVSGVAMLVLDNISDQTIQYAAFTLTGGSQELHFTLSTLPPGERIVLLEQNRLDFEQDAQYSLQLQNLALFDSPLSLQEESLEIQCLDGAVNITNISGTDLVGDIVLYYKNASQDLLYGGITYRIRLEEGLKAGEIRQLLARHITASSRIMFVTIG